MKRVGKKGRESCGKSYYECDDFQMCDVCCSGVANHPECKRHLNCKIDMEPCDGLCDMHVMNEQVQSNRLILEDLGNSLVDIQSVIRRLTERNKALEEKLKSMR